MPLDKSRFKFVRQADSLEPCPKCQGRGFKEHGLKREKRCRLCHGHQVVARDLECICGRPVRLDKYGQVENTIYSCGMKSCKEAIGHLPEKGASKPDVLNLGLTDEEEMEAAFNEGWMRMY